MTERLVWRFGPIAVYGKQPVFHDQLATDTAQRCQRKNVQMARAANQ